MAEQTAPPEVGAAAWGGMRWPERVKQIEHDATNSQTRLPEGFVTALVSLALVVIGGVTMTVGAGLLWGPGAALLVGGGVALTVGILLGVSR